MKTLKFPKPVKKIKKKKGVNKVKKTSRGALVRKLDKIVSEIVRKRTPYCVICGKKDQLQAGHLFTRAHYSTRWNLDNIWTQCGGCNMSHEYNPFPFLKWFEDKFGIEKRNELYNKWNQVSKFKNWELEEMYNRLKEFCPMAE